MTPSESSSHDLNGLLLDAVVAVRKTSINESLVERCRQSAIELGQAHAKPKSHSGDGWSLWRVPVTLAASLLIVINLVQAYTRLPSSSRELVAIHESAKAGRMYIYSDLRIDPAPSHQAENDRSKP